MVTSISVVGQHPIGLDLLISNLKWAIDRPHKIVIFTFRKNNLPKEKYPDVEFIEIDNDPTIYYEFHDHEIADYIKKCKSDILVMTELDTLFTTKIGDIIDQVRASGDIQVGVMNGWYDLSVNGRVVYPRLWEGGMVLKTRLLLECYQYGFDMTKGISELGLHSRFKELGLKYRMGGVDYNIGEYYQQFLVHGDNYCALQLYCFIKKIRCIQHYRVSHIKAPETIHRYNPELYQEIDTKYDQLMAVGRERGTGTVFHMFLLGKVSRSTFDKCCKAIDKDWSMEIKSLMQHAEEWMSPEVFANYKYAIRRLLVI